jgi:hypothetical protein
MNKGLVAIIIAVIMGMALIFTANIISNAAVSIKNKGYVQVTGYAKQEILSDLGIIEAVMKTESPDIKECYKKLAGDRDRVKIYLGKAHNVSSGELVVKPASIQEVYKINDRGFDTEELVKYVLTQTIRVETKDVKKVEKISSEMIELLDEGVKIDIMSPEYHFTALEGLKIEMIGRATSNARERAIKIAKEGKFKLGSIADVRVGVFQITPKNSTDVSDYGYNDTSSVEKEIKSVVEIKYFVK